MPETFPRVQGRCPACGFSSLFLGAGGYVTCSRIECPAPSDVAEIGDPEVEARLMNAGYDEAVAQLTALGGVA